MKQPRLVCDLSFPCLFLPFLCRFIDSMLQKELRLITTPDHCVHSPTRLLNSTPGLTFSLMKKKKQQQPRTSPITSVKVTEKSEKSQVSSMPNSRTHHRTKSLEGTVIKGAVEYSLKYITFFFCLHHPTSGLQGTAP